MAAAGNGDYIRAIGRLDFSPKLSRTIPVGGARIQGKVWQGMMGRLIILLGLFICFSATARAQESSPPDATAPTQAAAQEIPGDALAPRGTPLPGSQLPTDQNKCYQCHGDPDPIIWQGDKRRFIVTDETLAHDVHWRAGVVCHDCHGGDPSGQEFAQVHNRENGFRSKFEEIQQSCARCHQDTMIDVTRRSVHAKAGPKNLRGEGTALQCSACHGEVKHGLLSHKIPESPLFITKQAETCGQCHKDELVTYQASVHGPDIVTGDVTKSATCASCHGAHGIFRIADNRSTLFETNVGQTCGTCHPGLEAQLANSVHGTSLEKLIAESKDHASTLTMRKPVCTSCHLRHEPPAPEEPPLLTDEAHATGCGNCHANLASRKLLAHHAERTAEGLVSAAECSDCHGAHAIPPLEDPASPLSPENRLATCQSCHTEAHQNVVANFADFNPHAYYKEHDKYPGMSFVHHWIEMFVLIGLLFFVFHTTLWILRALLHLLLHGPQPQPQEGEPAIIRFSKLHCAFRNALMLTLIGLATTGLILRYWPQPWAQVVGGALGGFRVLRGVHLAFGFAMLGCCVVYTIWLVQIFLQSGRKLNFSTILGPDSPVPNRQDFKDIVGMFRWFFGLGEKPKFDRWTFWEKFDYWAIVFIVVVIGGTGVLMWWPNLLALVIPGSWINMGQMIHYDTALMATTFALAIRFINTHFRPEKFPMDLSVITGLVTERHLEYARPKLLARLREQGELDSLRTVMPSRRRIWLLVVGAGIVQVIGLVMLAVTLFASLEG